MTKLEILQEIEGYTNNLEFLKRETFDSVCAGICTNPDCDYSCNVEPDQDKGWCEECETNTVTSSLMLAGLI